ncbi:uncharacterized protein LOC113521958 isoform X2 [Galleria mellonella]|uniref:Uncharacterized protein LOC113521958 isoform X2 n=1 Tax=Galleria mellonella TaxID=7137 RepID=A0A6J3C4A6_GALME|nr:uncharacterized protein LOC113521958 isoform X2 [Galleria mellonella]
MSKDINLDSNNLCITEEVFENFQAQSLCEDEEYITLSDILSPVPRSSDSIADQKETSDIDELLSIKSTEINNECNEHKAAGGDILQLDISEKSTEDCQEHKVASGSKSEHLSISNVNNCVPGQSQSTSNQNTSKNDIQPKQSKKRGRKKKSTLNSNTVNSKNIFTDESMVSQINSIDLNKQKPSQAKRGPKKKDKPIDLVQHNNKNQLMESVDSVCFHQPKVYTRRSTSANSISKTPVLNENIKPRKRGRPKSTSQQTAINSDQKIISENSVLSEAYNTDTDHSSIQNNKNIKRRGRPRKVISNQTNNSVVIQSTSELKLSQNEYKDSNGKNISTTTITNILLPTECDNTQILSKNNILEDGDSNLTKSEQCIDKDKIAEKEDSDDGDNVSLIQLKKTLESNDNSNVTLENNVIPDSSTETDDTVPLIKNKVSEIDGTPTKRNSKMPIMLDFEYNIDSIVSQVKSYDLNEENKDNDTESSLLVEDTSKRPVRRKIKQNLHYDEDSDEDPFANVELSDDEPRRNKKGSRYYSDDEYIPGAKRGKSTRTESSDSEDVAEEGLKKQKRKRFRKSDVSQSKSPRKRVKKCDTEKLSQEEVLTPEVTTIPPNSSCSQDNDIEICLESSVIKAKEEISDKSNYEHDFENFIVKKIQGTNLKIKKLSPTASTQSSITPLEIPVLDANDIRKTVEMCTQTSTVQKKAAAVQTMTPYDVPMKNNVTLTKEKAQKACEFLNGIVKTTSELGVLMTQKSEDFMKKKINTEYVTDTFKMDYCVKKSFLLFKLAKHNLIQMEEDLAKQYEEFLKINDLLIHRDEVKTVIPKVKIDNSDSDCEIVEEPIITKQQKPQVKAKFNPKTVFLNKELSIKIAKKPTDEKKLNIKGKNTVWINDSVMVKKVKPTQSFLAQDSRNKKPPDNYISFKMVSDFFRMYNRKKVVATCAPFVSREWLHVDRSYVCNYFVVQPEEYPTTTSFSNNDAHYMNNSDNDATISDVNKNFSERKCLKNITLKSSPKTLFLLCTEYLQNIFLSVHIKTSDNDFDTEDFVQYKQPHTLFRLCLDKLSIELDKNYMTNNQPRRTDIGLDLDEIDSSKQIYQQTSDQAEVNIKIDNLPVKLTEYTEIKSLLHSKPVTSDLTIQDVFCTDQKEFSELDKHIKIQTLFSLCVELIQNKLKLPDSNRTIIFQPNLLKYIVYKKIKELLYDKKEKTYGNMNDYRIKDKEICFTDNKVNTLSNICLEFINTYFINNNKIASPIQSMTINSVNTMSEEAFLNIENPSHIYENFEYFDDEDSTYYADECDQNEYEEASVVEDSNWVNQIKMKELRSYVDPLQSNVIDKNRQDETFTLPFMVHIKSEPEDEFPNTLVDTTIIKSEPIQNFNGINIIPESIITKKELDCPDNIVESIQRRDSNSYDVDEFESFVTSHKVIKFSDTTSKRDIFSQSNLRIRRQFEPDSDLLENDMGLLIPHTFEPMKIDKVKDRLMESSSDENNSKKTLTKKKIEKRKKRSKKMETKANSKDAIEATKNKATPPINEVAVLTRRMRERIRQEQKKIESSDSESENISLSSKRNKKNVESTIDTKQNSSKHNKVVSEEKVECKQTSTNKNKYEADQIQCNSVDSTAKIGDDLDKSNGPDINKEEQFTGFSAMDQNGMFNYQKYVNYVYDKIIARESSEKQNETENQSKTNESSDVITTNDSDRQSPVINYEDPPEYLVCQPTMPIFDNDTINLNKRSVVKASPKRYKTKAPQIEESKLYVERYGWKCYPVDINDTKIYQHSQIILEKLPESFVQTYFKYQVIANKNKDDEEVEKLTNLQSLNRISNAKDGKSKGTKSKVLSQQTIDEKRVLTQNSTSNSRPNSPLSDHCRELTPSEDEGEQVETKLSPLPSKQIENNLAKNSLMNDKDSESDTEKKVRIKIEPDYDKQLKERKVSTRSKSKQETVENPESLMLTADKMMNKELTILHAPVVLAEKDAPDTSVRRPVTRNKWKNTSKSQMNRDNIKQEEDSSSEEEKQWVTTKEKLLKRLEKKQETAIADDAKRAKIVNEFIERRGDGPELRVKPQRRPRRSVKKRLERQKQLRILSKELFGESSDPVQPGKRYHQPYTKGRRNIRKVIDKKSLARSTVLANMEELERKRRLNMKQNRLRELLGLEEGVNVLVINDEVCLEYDFEQNQPVVTIHPFFTKVMKAHQYEGVKFMWDACFESLAHIASGHRGGGCILAHCMGLGKTLQVLALLHTVLTHPGVGMQRVLVCCPLSTVLNWVDEIHKWIGPVTDQIKVFELSKLKKTYERAYQLEDWYNGGGIFIIGYELFRNLSTLDPVLDDVRPTIVNKIRTALLDPGPDIIVCDEGHLLKNDCSVLAVAMSRVVTKRRIILTGTPMQNNLREYYCMVDFVKPNLLGTYAEYSNRFENPIMNGQHRDSREEDIKLMKARTHILHKVLEGCLQRQEASVLYPYLPKKYEYTVFISLTKCQWDMYKHYLVNYTKQSKQNILKDFHVLQKIWSHPQVMHNFQIRTRDVLTKKVKVEKLEDDLATEDLGASEDIKPTDTEVWWLQYLENGAMLDSLDSSNKFVVVFRILDECLKLGDKVLIFSTSLYTMDALEFFLRKINKWSLGQEYYRLDGSVPAEVRQKWCREFNAEQNTKTKLFLISTRAGSLGLNMTAANRVIILDTSWNPAHDIQSIFRVYRFGQKKDCYIYRLVALGTMEQKIYERSVTKQAVSCRVVDEQQIDRHYNMEELTELYRFDEGGAGVAGGVAAGVRDVALLRVARLPALHAVHEHDSLLRGSEPALPEHERAAAWMQFQQEHAGKQIQDLKVTKKGSNKRQHATDNLKAAAVKEEPVVDIKADPDFKPSESKAKKNKKSIISCRIPIQTDSDKPQSPSPTTSHSVPNVDKSKEEIMVKKISELLVEYDFQNTHGVEAVPLLVKGVRELVSTGHTNSLPENLANSELIGRIANVLLQKEDITLPNVTDIVHESVNNTWTGDDGETPPKPKPRSKPGPKSKKTEYKCQETSSTSTASTSVEKINDGRIRRKAAVEAIKYIEKVTDESIVNLDDSDNNGSSTDIVPETIKKKIDSTKELNKKLKKEQKATKEATSKEKNKFEKEVQPKGVSDMDTSILLSDDDESAAAPPPQLSSQQQVDTEAIPLHSSLLTNKNFIKIVAHTYLSGNPMLDDDAATLAAQYSTYKALKEIESTGKPLTSGPIYDIALKVLGIDVLKKLHKTTKNLQGATSSSSEKTAARKQKESILESEKILNNTPTPIPKSKTKKKTATLSSASKSIPTPTVTTASNVVPVGLSAAPNVIPAGLPASSKVVPVELSSVSNVMPVRLSSASNVVPVGLSSAPNVVPVGLTPAPNVMPVGLTSAPNVMPVGLTPAPNVVPVGLFKRTIPTERTRHEPNEECILPDDDDDVSIVSDPPPPPTQSFSPRIMHHRGQSQPLIVTTVRATNSSSKMPIIPPQPSASEPHIVTAQLNTQPIATRGIINTTVTVPVPPVIDVNTYTTASNAGLVTSNTNTDADTICLDSDEEFPPVEPQQVTEPTPCALIRLAPKPPQTGPLPNIPQMTTAVPLPKGVLTKVHDPASIILTARNASSPTMFKTIIQKPPEVGATSSSTTNNSSSVRYIVLPPSSITQVPDFKTLRPISLDEILMNKSKQFGKQDNSPSAANSPVVEKSVHLDTTSGAAPKAAPTKNVVIKSTFQRNPTTENIPKTSTSNTTKNDAGKSLHVEHTESVLSSKSIESPISNTSVNVLNKSLHVKHAESVSSKSNKDKTSSDKIQVLGESSSGSNSSSSSRPSSPDDPLSILKDVVHIQAYDTPKPGGSNNAEKSNITPKPFEKKSSSSNIIPNNVKAVQQINTKLNPTGTPIKTYSKVVTSKGVNNKRTINVQDLVLKFKSATYETSNQSLANQQVNKSATKSATRAIITTKHKSSTEKSKLLNETLKSVGSVAKSKSMNNTDSRGKPTTLNKANERVLGMVDLTETHSNSKPSVVSIATSKTKSTPKSTVLLRTNTTTTPAKGSPTPISSSSKTWSDNKKRPATSATSAPKKMKTDQLMTLKDFNIDDIDDVIELE